jgi:CYTH domain-containing protein
MAQEIERKFLVSGDYQTMATDHIRITQGYISSAHGRTVRVRIAGNKAFLTIKGASNASGTSRFEWEKAIDVDDARQLMELCEPGMIDKIRHIVPFGGHRFEVDEFLGENAGLVVAEVELSSEDEFFERPPFLAQEVTGDRRYYNSSLTKLPFTKW